MNPIFVVVGSSAVGKSTTSKALAAQFSRSIHIPVDDLRHMVVSGLVLPSPHWSNDLMQQIGIARQTAVSMALNYHRAGFVPVIDDFWDPHNLEDYQPLFQHPAIRKIVLYPSQHEAHQRNFQRSGNSPARAYIDEAINVIYQHLNAVVGRLTQDDWCVIDTTVLSVEATVAKILEQEQRRSNIEGIGLEEHCSITA